MALDGQAYSPQEFLLGFEPEATLGTDAGGTRQQINIDSPITYPELNLVQTLDVRSGVGRTLKATDTFTCNKSIYKEISFTGIADTTVCPLLIQNLTGNAVGTSPAGYGIVSSFTPDVLEHARTSGTILHTVTVEIKSPEATSSIIFPGCVVTKLSFTAGIGDENGRVKMSGTFATGYKETYSDAGSSFDIYGSTFYYLSQMSAKTTFAGIDNCVLDSLTIDLENPTQYGGFQGTDGDPQSIHKGIPAFIAKAMATVKYDANTAPLHAAYSAGANTAAIELSDNADWTAVTANSFALKAAKGIISSPPAFNDNTSMYLDVEVTMTGDDAAQDHFEIVL